MRNPFDRGNWIEHKQSRSHMSGMSKLGIFDSHEKPLPKRRSAVQSLRVRLKDMSNGEYAFCAKSFQAEVKKQAREDQGMLVKVINSLSCLVSEQQDDIQELRARLREMHHGMAQMTSAFEDVQDSQHKLSQNVCSYLDEVALQPSPRRSFCGRRRRASTYDLRSQKSSEGYDTEDTDKSLTDMSIFEDQTELTEME